jgi:polysaccharide export outer membrane protein
VNIRVLGLSAALTAAAVCLFAASTFAAIADSSQPAGGSLTAGADPTASASPAASSVPAAGSIPAPVADANYRIVEDDVLRLDVWGEPQLSGMQFQVAPGGMISVPYLGEMKVVGLTQTQISQNIAKLLADQKIVYDAKVQLSIVSMRKSQVRVLGAVTRPGSFDFKDGDTVLDAIADAGSYSDDAMLEAASITHKGSDKQIPINLKGLLAGHLEQNSALVHGDVIYIPHEYYNNKIYVLGQVNRPGQYSLKDKTTILAAISLAGGANDRGSIRDVVLMRGDPAKPQKVKVNFKKLFDTGDLSQDLALSPGDIVVVPDSKKFDWNKVTSIISAIVNVSYLRRLGF